MKSNVTVGPPIDLLAYFEDELNITRHRRFEGDDPALVKIRLRWDQALCQAVFKLPDIRFKTTAPSGRPASEEESIQLVEHPTAEGGEFQGPDTGSRPST